MGKDLKGKNLGKGYVQRKDGRYEARCTINGNKIDIIDQSLSSLKKKFETAKKQLLVSDGILDNRISLKEWYMQWFERCKKPQLKTESSANAYNRKVSNTYIAILGDKCLNSITQINIQDATNELVEKGYSEKTIKEGLGVVRECYDSAIANKVATYNPCVSIYVKGAEKMKKRTALTQEEMMEFLEEVKDSFYYEAYMVLFLTGLRISEFSGLTQDSIDYDNKCIHVTKALSTEYLNGVKREEFTTTKTVAGVRDIPFFDDIEVHLRNWEKKKATYKDNLGNRWRENEELGDLFFCTSMGSPLTRYSFQSDLKRVKSNLNLKRKLDGRKPFPQISPHIIRHTFATVCYTRGLDPKFAQKILGHSSIKVTLDIYTDLSKELYSSELEKVQNNGFLKMSQNESQILRPIHLIS